MERMKMRIEFEKITRGMLTGRVARVKRVV